MPLDEIEIIGSSLSLQCYTWKPPAPKKMLTEMNQRGTAFALAEKTAGFHDLDADERVVRGGYSVVESFEVEHLAEGFNTKSLLERILSCEFIGSPTHLFVAGKRGPMKALSQTLAGLTGNAVVPMAFETRELAQFQERLSVCKAIVLVNPKDKEVRRCRLAGTIESYTDYNVIDPLNHGIDSVSGLVDSPLGPMTVTIGQRGTIRFSVRKGFVLTLDAIMWLLALVQEKQAPPGEKRRN